MKEFIAETIERRMPPNRNVAVEEHLRIVNADTRDREAMQHIRSQIEMPARPIAPHIVCIPVAAHQESGQIARALEQYALQQTEAPFTVVLGLNSPTIMQADDAIVDTLNEVEKAKHRYPHVDIRSAMTYYDDPTIGMIRRDLWNATLQLSVDEGAYNQPLCDEVIGINHDIDTEYLSPRYMARVQQYYGNKQARYAANGLGAVISPPASSVTRHAMDENYYNSSLGAKWADYAAQSTNNWYEAGVVSPMSHYAYTGGFKTGDRTYETGVLMNDVAGQHRIPGTVMHTSPRRYVDRLGRHGFDNIWTNDSFGPIDDCRDSEPHYDISSNRLQYLMMSSKSLHDYLIISAQYAVAKKHNEIKKSPVALTRDEWGVETVATVLDQTAKVAYVAFRGFGLHDWARHIYKLSSNEQFFYDVLGAEKNAEKEATDR